MPDSTPDAYDGSRTSTPVRVLAAVAAVFWGVLFFGLIDLLAFAQGPEFHAGLVLSTGWGLLFLVLVAVPLCVVVFAPAEAAASVAGELLAVAMALAVAAVLSGSPRHLLPAAGVAVTAVAVLPRRGGLRGIAPGWRPSWPSLAVVAAAAGPVVGYAWHAARSTGTADITDVTAGLDHWPVQAAFPLAVLLVAALAAGHPRGWRVPAWTATVVAAWFAVVCFAEPGLAASAGRAWSVATAVWAAVFAVVVHRTESATAVALGSWLPRRARPPAPDARRR